MKLDDLIARARERLALLTERERLAGAIFCIVLAVIAAMRLQEWNGSLASELDTARRQGVLVVEAVAEPGWPELRDRAASSAATYRERFWTGPTEGLVAANIESRLRTLPALAQARGLQVSVERRLLETDFGTAFDVSVQAAYPDVPAAYEALVDLQSMEQAFVLERLTWSFGRIGQVTVSMAGQAPVRIEAEAAS